MGATPNHPSHGWPWLSIETYGDLGVPPFQETSICPKEESTSCIWNPKWKHLVKPMLLGGYSVGREGIVNLNWGSAKSWSTFIQSSPSRWTTSGKRTGKSARSVNCQRACLYIYFPMNFPHDIPMTSSLYPCKIRTVDQTDTSRRTCPVRTSDWDVSNYCASAETAVNAAWFTKKPAIKHGNGKSIINWYLKGTVIYKWRNFQHAMFDYPRVHPCLAFIPIDQPVSVDWMGWGVVFLFFSDIKIQVFILYTIVYPCFVDIHLLHL